MFLCHESKDYIKWIFNEVIGEKRQAMRAEPMSARKLFGVNCYVDLLTKYPQYSEMIEAICTPQHWEEVKMLLPKQK